MELIMRQGRGRGRGGGGGGRSTVVYATIGKVSIEVHRKIGKVVRNWHDDLKMTVTENKCCIVEPVNSALNKTTPLK